MMIFSNLAPNFIYNFVHAIAAAPAPLMTILTFDISFAVISSAFSKAAELIIAVPC